MRSLAAQSQDPVAWVVASLREDFKEELISRDARGRFASKKGGGKRSAAASKKRSSSLGKVAGVSAGAVAATVGVAALGAVYVASETRRASDDISGFDYPTEDPVDYSRYDDLKPGELLYKGFPVGPEVMRGGKNKGMLHYAVYVGKDPETGKHKLVECGEDPLHPGIPAIIESTIEDNIEAMPKEKRAVSSHYKAVPKEERLPRDGEPPLSAAEIIERANLLVGQPFRYNAVTNNCESIARAIVGDDARTTQGERISALGKKIMSSIFDERVFKGKWEDYGKSEFVKSSAEMAEILSDYSQQRLSETMWRELKHVQGDWRTKKANAAKLKENIYAAALAAARTSASRRSDSEDEGHNRLADLLGLESVDAYAKKVEEFAQASEDETTRHLVRRQMWSNYFQVVLGSIHVTINGKTGDLKRKRLDSRRFVIDTLRRDDFAMPYGMVGDPIYKEMMVLAVVGTLRNDYKEELHPRDALGRFAKKGSSNSARQSAAGKGRKSSEESGGSAWDRITFPGGVATGLGIGALAVGGLAVGGSINTYKTVKEEGEKGASDISHMDFPGKDAEYDFSRYDDLEPGTMIRKGFRAPGMAEGKAFLHYAVYVGKDEKTGEHMVVHAVPDPKDKAGTVAIVKQSIEDAVKRGGDFELENHTYYEAMPENERIRGKGVPSEAEAVERAESLIGQPYDYRSTRSNCESFARLITEGVAYETQGRGTASKAGMEMVANLTKVAQDVARSRSEIWKGREPKDVHGWAEMLAKMQAGQLSEEAKAYMAENRAAWESAPELPVGGATKRNLKEMFEMAIKDFVNPGRKRSDAEGDDAIFDLLGMKTPAEYQKDIDRACEGQSKPLQRETARFMWSNYLQMFFALASDSKSPPKSLREDAERPWDEEGEDSLGESGDCEREDTQNWEEQKHPRDEMGRFATKANRNAMYSQVGQELGMPAEDVKVILKEHQTRISEKLKNQHGLVVDHDMGSGKTITAIAAAEEYGGAVVVVPASLRDNFRKELDKYGAEGKYEIHSYESFAKYKPSTEGRMLIVDEAHRLRNYSLDRTKVVEQAGKEAEKVLLLTGTPIPNKPHDAGALINIAAGEEIIPTSESGFNARFMETKVVIPNWFQKTFQKVPVYGVRQPKNLDEFKEKTAKYVDHYAPTREGYPKVEEHHVEVFMSRQQEREQKAWSEGAGRDIQLKLQKGIPLNAGEADRLNFFLNSTRQVANTAKEGDAPPKVKSMVDRIKSDGTDRPSVIYSNYIGSGVREVERELEREGITFASFTGEVSEKQRKKVVEDYNSGKIKVLIISSSGGEGLDLKRTSQIHIMEPHWHSEKLNQVAARAIRYKSHEDLPEEQQKVEVYRYISKMRDKKYWTADQSLAAMSQQKEEMNSKFLEQWGHESLKKRKNRRDEEEFMEDSWEEDRHPRDAQGRFAPASSARQSATSREFLLGGGNAHAKSQNSKKTGLAGDAISAGQSYTKTFADDPKFVAAQKNMMAAQAKNHEATARILSRREKGQQPTREEMSDLIKAQAETNRVLHREFLPIATKKMEGVRNELLNDSPISKEEAKAIVGQRQIKGRPFPEPLIGFQVKGMLEEHTRLIGEDLPTFKKMDIYSLTYGRSYADPANGVVAIAGDQINKPIIFHEATHHMEASNPRALRTAEDWVKQRNRGRGEMPLSLVNPAYGTHERTMKDEFFNPYVGKLYKEKGKVEATEALSMGMQYFDSPKSMAMLYAVDPEHFHMTVGVIRPKGKGKARKDAQEIRLDGLLRVPQGSSDYDKALIGRMNDSLKLDEKTGCFLWTASTRKDGYGQVKVNGELKSAHKVAYTLIKGKVPDGQLVCHRCDNPACCNPAHLFLGDSSKNVGDMVKKGRNSNGRGDSMDNLITLLREDADKGGPKRFGIWFEGRRTPIVVTANSRGEAIKRARLLKRRGGSKVASARVLNEQENRVADRGKWVRTGPNGEKPGESKIRGHGPKPKGFEGE